MSTKFLDLNNNNDYILLDPISLNPSDSPKSLAKNDVSTKESSSYVVPPELLHFRMDFKLRNQSTRAKFKVLQKWEGIVEEFDGENIQVKLIDLTNGGTDEEAQLDIQDISKDDLQLVKEGAMFYWSIGYETQLDRQVKKSSFIKFKRLPKLDPSQFDAIQDRVNELKNDILLD